MRKGSDLDPEDEQFEIIVARAMRFLHDLASDEIEELADYLAQAGFTDAAQASAAIRSSLIKLGDELRAAREIEQATIVDGLLQKFDQAWERW